MMDHHNHLSANPSTTPEYPCPDPTGGFSKIFRDEASVPMPLTPCSARGGEEQTEDQAGRGEEEEQTEEHAERDAKGLEDG